MWKLQSPLASNKQRDDVTSQRLRVQGLVEQIHEKSIVLVNILRDIVENETLYGSVIDDENLQRRDYDRSERRAEILFEMRHLLQLEDLAQPAHA